MVKIVKIAEMISIWTVSMSLYHGVNTAQIPAASACQLRVREFPGWWRLSRAKKRITKLDGEKKIAERLNHH